jgi:hypothetical protein
MKECDNSKIHISRNFILSIRLLIMFDTLLLRPSLHCNTPLHFTILHHTSPNYTSLHFATLHHTTLHYTYWHFNFSHLHFTTLSFSFTHVHLKKSIIFYCVSVSSGIISHRCEFSGLLNDLEEKEGYCKMNWDRTLLKSRFGRGYGPVVRENT